MRTVAAGFEALLASTTLRIAELYEITLNTGTTYYYTTLNEAVSWGSPAQEYQPIPIKRTEVHNSIALESMRTTIELANITGDLYSLVAGNILEGALVLIKRIFYDQAYATGWEVPIFYGFADVSFDRRALTLDCIGIADSLNIRLPKNLYQEPCNNTLFDATCGLTRAEYRYEGTATGGSSSTLIDTTRGTVYKCDFDGGDEDNPIVRRDALHNAGGTGTAVCLQIVYLTATTGTIWFAETSGVAFADDDVLDDNDDGDNVTLNGTPAEDTTFYEAGEVEMTSGNNNGQRRQILSNSGSTVTFMWPMPNAVANTDTYKIFPGCDKRAAEGCKARFGNEANFYGFLYVPKVQEVVM